MEEKFVVNYCLFCASPCALTFGKELKGEVGRSHHEDEAVGGHHGGDDYDSRSFLPFLEEEVVPKLGKQLKVLFIMRDILNIPKEKLIKYLTKLEGKLHPEFWVKVCEPCGKVVGEYYRLLKLVSKLQTKLHTISSHLKKNIWNTTNPGEPEASLGSGGDDGDGEDNEEAISGVWRDIRQQVVADMIAEQQEQPPDSSPEPVTSTPLPPLSFDWEDAYDADIDEIDIPEMTDQNAEAETTDCPELGAEEFNQLYPLEQEQDLRGNETNHVYVKGGIMNPCPIDPNPTAHDSGSLTQSQSSGVGGAPPPAILVVEDEDGRVFVNVMEEKEGNSTVGTVGQGLPKRRAPKRRSCRRTVYNCDECGYTTTVKGLLASHMELHKPNGPTSVLCSDCGWRVPSKKLKAHIGSRHTRHHGKTTTARMRRTEPYKKCKECGYLAHDWIRLENHMKLHLSGRGQVCEICKWLCLRLAQHKGTWHPEEPSKLAEVQQRIANRPAVTVKKRRQTRSSSKAHSSSSRTMDSAEEEVSEA